MENQWDEAGKGEAAAWRSNQHLYWKQALTMDYEIACIFLIHLFSQVLVNLLSA